MTTRQPQRRLSARQQQAAEPVQALSPLRQLVGAIREEIADLIPIQKMFEVYQPVRGEEGKALRLVILTQNPAGPANRTFVDIAPNMASVAVSAPVVNSDEDSTIMGQAEVIEAGAEPKEIARQVAALVSASLGGLSRTMPRNLSL